MRSLLLRSRSVCLPAGVSCRGGESTFWLQQQQDTVRVVRVDTMQLLHFPESLRVAELLQQLNVPHHCVFQVESVGSSPSPSMDLSSESAAGVNLTKGPLLSLDTEMQIGCLYFLKPLPSLLYKLRTSSRHGSSPFSDNPFADSTRHSCCCAARHRWGAQGATSPTLPCFATSLMPDQSGKLSPPQQHKVATSSPSKASLKRTWSALAGRVAFLNLGDHSKNSKRTDLEALDLVVQATILSEQESAAAIPDTPKPSSCAEALKAVRVITNGWYAPSQAMRSTWKPELRGICERSASARPQVYRQSLETCMTSEGTRDDLEDGSNLEHHNAGAVAVALPAPCLTKSASVSTCAKAASKRRSKWNRDLRSLVSFGGFGSGVSVPQQWR